MSKIRLMAVYEYRKHVFKKRFILVLLSFPFMLALGIGMGVLANALTHSSDALGYVDQAGVLTDPLPAPQPGRGADDPETARMVPLIAYESEEAARSALEAGDIQAYYVIAPDYRESSRVALVYFESPPYNATRQFWDFMQINRLRDLELEVAQRAVADSTLVVLWPEDSPGGARRFSGDSFLNILMPLFVGMAFAILLMISAGYLVGVVADEKENRTMEILVTSLSPSQLIVGKVIGIVGVTLTQLVAWAFFAFLAVWVGGQVLDLALLQNLSLDWKPVLITALVALPAYVLAAGLMTALGSTVTELQEAQQVSGLFMIPTVAPLWLAAYILANPNSAVAVGLSLFPLTSVATIGLRLSFGPVPTWQIAANVMLCSLCAAGSLWLAARAFRLGMLRYGQKVTLPQILRRRERVEE